MKYSTSNKKVATVTSKGVVTAKGKGTAKITIKATDGSKESATVKITASAVPVTKVTLKPAQVSLSIGMAKQLKVSVKPAKATNRNVTYTSSNENVASVSSAGVVTAKATGTAAITATAQDGSKKSSTVSVTVNPVMAANVSVTPDTLALKTGASQKLQTVVSPANTTNKNVSYTSSAPDVASVSSDGTVTAKGKGSAVITVTTQDGSNKQASVRVSVSDVEVKIADLAVVENDLVLAPCEAKQITANITPANATNQTLRYTSSDSNAAEVSETGVITAKAQGSAVITVETTDGSNKKAEIKVEVTNKDKVRTIVTTDGEVDDMDSFMRLMLYSNEMDLAGLILTSSTYHYAGDPDKGITPKRWTGTAWAGEVLEDYSEVYSNLTVHSADYPTPAYLESILKIGNIKNVGEMDEITEGSEFMKEILLDDDDRTLYIQTWGGTNTTARALKSIEEEYKGTDQWEAIQQKIYDKAVIYIILNQDATYSNYIAKNWPGIKVINDGGNFWRFAYMWKSVPEPLTQKLQGDWNYNNIKLGHGPLLENYKLMGDGTILEGEDANEQRGSEDYLIRNPQYQRYDFISEGDSPSFFYLLDTGLRSMEDPTYGGWGGRFGVEPDGTYKNTVSDYNIYTQKDDKTYTLTRWFNDIQGDFAARADWCVADEFREANHRPTVSVEEGLDLTGQPGERVKLHADGADPDGDLLTYKWWQYYEADTYKGTEDGKFNIIGKDSNTASFVVPADAKDGDTIHLVVQVTDDGAHNMNHYQRVILTVTGAQQVESVTVNGASEIQVGSKTTLNAVVLPEMLTNKNVTWSSDNESVATVTDKGQVTGVSFGTAAITAVSKVDNKISGTFEIQVTRAANDPANQNPRAIITQDAEVDDQNSLVHALLYANEIDFQGIIQTSSKFHWIGDPDAADAASQTKYRWPGTDWMNEYADDYEAVYENLRTHDPNYPTPAYIRSIIKIGNIGYKGEVKNETEGSKLVERALLDNDPRKLYLMAWGGTNTITRALMSIEEKYKDTNEWAAIREKIVNKSMICAFGKQDQTYDEYIGEEWPEIAFLNVGGGTTYGYGWSRTAGSVDSEGKRTLSGAWMRENLDYGHGALLDNYVTWGDGTYLDGEEDGSQFGTNEELLDSTNWWGRMKYQRYDFLSEGDSPSFFYLMDTGLRSLEDPAFGSYGGRYYLDTSMKNSKGQQLNWYKTVQDYDPLQDKKVNSDWRWMADLQHEFATRADWCITPNYEDANHAPALSIKEGLDFTAKPGETLKLHAEASDPDGDYVSVKWLQYFEADTYVEPEANKGIYIKGANSDMATITVPEDAKEGDTLIILVQASDNGTHSLSHYQEILITVEGAQAVESVTVEGASEVEVGSKVTLNAVVLPETLTNKNVTWKSDNEAVATVSDKGQVTGVSFGTANITAVSQIDKTVVGTFDIQVTRAANDPANQNPRAIITQDAEVDDQNSLVHALLYANEIDFQGIIQTSSKFHWIGDPDAADAASQTKYRWPGTDWMNEYADDYEAVYENLRTHDPNYPTPAYIRSIIKIGNIGYKGEVKNETEGSKLVERALLDNDPRKLYLMAWGGTNTITRALMSIEEKYKDTDEWAAIREKIVNKSMICAFGKQDQTYDEYIGEEWPEIAFLNVGGGTTYGYAWSRTAGSVDSEGKRTLSGAWMRENLDYGHGALLDNYVTWGDGTYLDGEEDGSQFGTNESMLDSTNWWGRMKYQRYDFLSEGDSPSFFYLMDTGLRSLEDPAFGSYGGRYYLDTSMKNSKGQQLNWYKTVQDYDPLQDKKVNSDWRWMADLQHEFATRADWCITPNYEDANHAPALSIKEGLDFTAKPGETLKLHAEASDPDGDYVSVKWSQYFEADTYVEPEANKGIYIKGANSDMATITVPEDAKEGDTLIILVQASDNGTHSLSHYQEILITVEGAQAVESVTVEGASEVEVGNKVTLNAVVLPETLTNKTVTWSSDNEAVAVTDKGQVTGVSFGTANITAVSQIDKTVMGTFEIKVTRAKDDANSSKVRTIVTTDGEVDDMDSFMRLMLYSNEMDIAGLILSSSTYHYAGDPDKGIAPKRWTGTAWAGEVLDDYEEVYENLKVHSRDFPAPEYLKSILKIGNIKNVGEMEEITEGSEFMKDILLDDDDRTLYIQTWGGTNTTARALKSIEEEYKGTDQWDEIQQKIYDKAVIYIILNQDATYSDYIAKQWPGIRVINDGGNFWQFAYMWKRVAEPLTAKLQGDWYYNNIKTGHGALLANYKLMGDGTILEGEDANEQRGSEDYLLKNPQYNRYDFISEGDSPSFFYLLDTGLRSLEDPTYGGWGGRFGVMEDGTYKNTVKDYNIYTNSQDTAYTLTRWFNDIQSDFAARADWCIASDYADANHMPSVSVKEGLDLSAAPGERLKLHAEGSDPDGDKLTYKWWQYYEADTYDGTADGNMSVTGKNTDTASFVIPEDAQNGDTIHMVIQVTDNGAHNLNYYQRVIITVTGREEIQNVEIKMPQGVDANAIALGTRTAGWGGSPYAVQLTAEVTPALTIGKTFTWSSSDVSVATVDSTGKVTPLTAGSVRITAAANDGSGKEASIDLTIVELKPSAVEVTSGGFTKLYVNATLSLNASVNPTDAVDKSVTWTSDNENVAVVSQDGVVTGIGAGTVVISAVSNADQSVFGEITLVVEEENVNRRSAPVTEDASEVSTEAEEVQEDVIREEVPNVENQNEETQNEETQTEVSSNGETQL